MQGLGGLPTVGAGGQPQQMQDYTSQLLNNPMLQGLMNNPELLRSVLTSNPVVSQVGLLPLIRGTNRALAMCGAESKQVPLQGHSAVTSHPYIVSLLTAWMRLGQFAGPQSTCSVLLT